MSEVTLVSAEQFTNLVQKVVASRGFKTSDQNTADYRATFAMRHGLANNDLVDTHLASLDANNRSPNLLV